jgi:hypothetical protein
VEKAPETVKQPEHVNPIQSAQRKRDALRKDQQAQIKAQSDAYRKSAETKTSNKALSRNKAGTSPERTEKPAVRFQDAYPEVDNITELLTKQDTATMKLAKAVARLRKAAALQGAPGMLNRHSDDPSRFVQLAKRVKQIHAHLEQQDQKKSDKILDALIAWRDYCEQQCELQQQGTSQEPASAGQTSASRQPKVAAFARRWAGLVLIRRNDYVLKFD